MKKIISLLLVAVMVLSMSVVAFAEDNRPVSVDLLADVEVGDIVAYTQPAYKLTLSYNYEKPTITVTNGDKLYAWDTENLRYYLTDEGDGGISGELEFTVTLTNYSNRAIELTSSLTMPQASGYDDIGTIPNFITCEAVTADKNPLFTPSDKEGYMQFEEDYEYPEEYEDDSANGTPVSDTQSFTIDFSTLTFVEEFFNGNETDKVIGTVILSLSDPEDQFAELNDLVSTN